MPHSESGGDQHRGAATSRVIAAQTPEGARPVLGRPHNTTSLDTTSDLFRDPLWPLVTALGEIAERTARRAAEEGAEANAA